MQIKFFENLKKNEGGNSNKKKYMLCLNKKLY